MEQNLNNEALKRRVTELERRLKEYERKEVRQNFQEVTKRLEKIAEMGDDGIIVFGEDYKVEFANSVASELTGYLKEKLVGMDFRRLLSERDIGYLDQMHSEVGADESKRVCTEMEVLTETGLKRDAEVCITIAEMERGRVKTYAYLRDITERKRMEREIREATKRFEKIAEMGEDGIIVFDEESRIEFANQMASEIMGFHKDQILGREFFSLIGKRDEEFLEEMVMRGEGLGQKVCTEMSLHISPGQVKETEVCLAPTQSEDGRIKTYAYIRDITERKKFEKALRESEEKYRNLFERVRHGLFISTKEGYFLDCNQAMWGLLGYEDKEGFLKIDIIKDLYVNPEDRKTFMELVEKLGFIKDFEVEFKKKNGERITVLLTATAKRDEKGTIIGYEGLNIDITDRKRMEKKLKEANDFLMNLIESSVDGIIVTDMKGDILIFNKGAENLLGYQGEEVVEKMNIRSIYQPGVAKEVMDKLRSPDFGGIGKLTSFPIFHRKKDGELIEGDLSASIIYDEKGNEIASIGIFKDLRERLKMERELREIQQALLQSEKLTAMGRLTSQIAHELNNPIYGIMNTLELLKTEIPPESKRRRILELSLSEIQRLSEMLRNMLSFSKPEEEKRRPVKIDELIEGILLVMEKQMKESNIQVEASFDSDIPEVMASTNQMRQVMLNILKNAKEAMPKGGTLTVRTTREGNKVLIHIQDTGIGIPEEIRDKIFEAFFTTKQKVKGVGLGLSVCYGIIKDHGGEIKVESEEGKGTTFTLSLPVT
ncbi:MAG: PAS domain-containing sensor histidine kinase [Deltaproteobacteria bacterium CG_4_8_14_3_um_filter_45_9]|nr:MAG: PAS domain-containing sensor histidine kinase [Deltaproteobacteria bacterium CG03_land_8_20_14_0_80_45_14]PIX21505.1 MAG: PAS domain-containing sensor histidine kinase [Deltaproteobacteria bacterium CG_4_8_14_3_um_filter_45_9]